MTNFDPFWTRPWLAPRDNPESQKPPKSGDKNQILRIRRLRFFLPPESLKDKSAKKSKSKGRPVTF